NRGTPRSRVMALAILHASSQDPELDEGEQQDDEREDERERRPQPELGLLESRSEYEQGHRARRVERPAVREDIDGIERSQHTDRRDGEDEERGGRAEREGDPGEELAFARAVEPRGLEEPLRNIRKHSPADHD